MARDKVAYADRADLAATLNRRAANLRRLRLGCCMTAKELALAAEDMAPSYIYEKAAKVRRDTNKMSTVEAARVRGWAVADNNEAEACFCGIAALAKGTGAV